MSWNFIYHVWYKGVLFLLPPPHGNDKFVYLLIVCFLVSAATSFLWYYRIVKDWMIGIILLLAVMLPTFSILGIFLQIEVFAVFREMNW